LVNYTTKYIFVYIFTNKTKNNYIIIEEGVFLLLNKDTGLDCGKVYNKSRLFLGEVRKWE